MPAWWAEHAWLGGPRTTPGVLLEVKDGRFAAVTPGLTQPPGGAHQLRGLTLPGLANVHSHAFHRALRGRTHEGPGSFWTWRQLMYSVAERLDPDSYLQLARATFAEMVLAGFTAVGEFHYLHHAPGGVPYRDPNEMGHALIEAARTAGIRLTLLDTCYLEGGFDRALAGPQLRFGDGRAEGWIDRMQQLRPEADVNLAAAVHSVRAVPPPAIEQVAAWAEHRGWRLHAHVSEQRLEQTECLDQRGATPLAVLGRAGAVGPRFTAIHGTHFSADDIAALAAHRGGCCLCPSTERDLGDGIGPAAALHGAGVKLSIGTDSHALIDGWAETRAVELDGRLAAERRGVLDTSALLEAATANGMEALGWDGGALVPGKLADFVALGLDGPGIAGCDPSLVSTAVFAASAADVHTVVVGGTEVVTGGVHRTIPDVGRQLASSISALWS